MTAAEWLHASQHLHLAHLREVYGEGYACPDFDAYEAAYAAGLMLAILAYRGTRVVGYSTAFLVRDPHTSELTAASDTLYVVPEDRGTLTGSALMRSTANLARGAGAVHLRWDAVPGSSLDSILAKRFTHRANVYCQSL